MYDIKIVDSLFCIFEIDSIVIDQPDDLSVASVVIHPTSGSSNGSVLLEVSGGTGTYSYEWFDASQQKISSDKDLENVKSGNNTVVITDENGCKKTFVFVLEDRVSSTDPFLESSVRLFPNPTSGFFTLEWNDNLLLEEIGIYNTIGQLEMCIRDSICTKTNHTGKHIFVVIIISFNRIALYIISYFVQKRNFRRCV